MYKLLFFGLTILLNAELTAQSVDSTRVDQIQAQRSAKAGNPAGPTGDSYFSGIVRLMRRSPVRFSVEGLGPGAGPTAGAIFRWDSPSDQIRARLWGAVTFHWFYTTGVGFEFPRIGGSHPSFAVESWHSDAPQLQYYGPGPDSSLQNRTDFRREETLFEFRVLSPPHRVLGSACRVGELLVNVGPGTNGSLPTTESVFGPDQAPGIDVQTDYLIAGCSAQVDLRDFPRNPRSGTYAAAVYDRYFAQADDRFSFHRFSAVAEQYVPFFNQKRVIVFRGNTELSFHSEDQVVPFYLQPTLGNDLELRGFRRYRFYDENSIALTGEYRWEICAGLDMALFVDTGKVFNRPGQISFSQMEISPGFGFRFKNRDTVFARLDTGFSHEGFQIWLKVGNLF